MDNSDRKHHSPDDYDSMDEKKAELNHSVKNPTQKELDDESISDEPTTQQESDEAEEEQIIIDDVVAFLTGNRYNDVESVDAANENNPIPSSEDKDEDENSDEESHADKGYDNHNNDDEMNLTQERKRLLKLQAHTMERLMKITKGIIDGYKASDTA